MHNLLDKEESERSEVMLGRIEELTRQTESPLQLERMFIRDELPGAAGLRANGR